MLILLSPAKTLDFASPYPDVSATTPRFHRQANQLVERLQPMSARDLAALMQMSETLGEKTAAQFASWKKSARSQGSRPAIFAYQGDVYAGLHAETLTKDDLAYATQHLRILSGLYGVLQPLDVIQPYRLEMATPLESDRGKDLYEFWGERITSELGKALQAISERVIVNLASTEYTKAIDFRRLDARVITPNFKEQQGDKLRFLSFFGKQARGMMARHLIETRAEDPAAVWQFRADGYRLNKKVSSDDSPIFSRPKPSAPTKKAPAKKSHVTKTARQK